MLVLILLILRHFSNRGSLSDLVHLGLHGLLVLVSRNQFQHALGIRLANDYGIFARRPEGGLVPVTRTVIGPAVTAVGWVGAVGSGN